jgi:hypothetical protein
MKPTKMNVPAEQAVIAPLVAPGVLLLSQIWCLVIKEKRRIVNICLYGYTLLCSVLPLCCLSFSDLWILIIPFGIFKLFLLNRHASTCE